MAKNSMTELLDYGQSLWLDNIRRNDLTSGREQRLIDLGLRGQTSNPTIFQKAVGAGDDYDDQIRSLIDQHLDAQTLFERLAVQDIQTACDLFRPLYDQTEGRDGFVSMELPPDLANDTAGSIETARRLWREIDRPNVMIKVPGTRAGVPAVEQLLADGLNINITLLFGVDRHYKPVMEAYLRGLERRAAAGQPINRIASVASFFVSRIDTAADKQLKAKVGAAGDPQQKHHLESLEGKTAIANAKMAYRAYQEIFGSDRFKALAGQGARVQRPLWASTSTKDPRYPDTYYVEELIGADTVDTVPLETLEAWLDHGKPKASLEADVAGARQVLDAVAAAGVDLEAVTDQLQVAGVQSFADSYNQLLTVLATKSRELAEVNGVGVGTMTGRA